MAEGDTLVNTLIGAVASTVLSGVVPFAPVFGGAIAGYLQAGDRNDGLRVGALAGLVAFVPALLFGILVLGFVLSVVVGGAVRGAPMGFSLFGSLGVVGVILFGVFGFAYFVGLSALGGWIGNYVKYDTDIDL
jgi:uncharacterized membrane protein (GlpM family)